MNNVWVYWQGDKLPYIELCIETIRRHSSNLNFVLLNDQKVANYLELPLGYSKLSVVHRADYIRVALLYKYGGIWLDADTIVLKPLVKYVKFLDKYKFLGFGKELSPQTAVIAGRPDSAILSLWFRYIVEFITYNLSISWGDLGPIALENVLTHKLDDVYEYYNVSPAYCVPVSCKAWKDFFSTRKEVKGAVLEQTGIVMLYNKFMKHKMKRYDREYLMESDMFISKLFRKALSYDRSY